MAEHNYSGEDINAYDAGADLRTKQNHVVDMAADGDIELPSANGRALGVLLNAPNDTEQADVMTGVGRRVEIVAGGTIAAGAEFAAKADGRIATAAGVSTRILGITEEASDSDGDLITCLWRPGGFAAQT